MTNDKKHVIPRRQYKRKRREFFHNEEREQRIQAQKEAEALKAEKERAQEKNNAERVKDNLRKARVEKITHDEYEKGKSTQDKSLLAQLFGDEDTASTQNKQSEEAKKESRLQHDLYKQQAQHIQQSQQLNHEKAKQTESTENVDDETQASETDKTSEPIHQYSNRQDWTTKITAFISKEWAKILIVLAALLIIILLFAIFNNVNKSDKDTTDTAQAQNKTETTTMKNANAAVKSVVSIENNTTNTPKTVDDVEAQTQKENDSGSGVVYKEVDDILYILTNAHVVGDRKTHELTYDKTHKVTGKVIGTDPWTDIAVLTVKKPKNDKLQPFKLGDSSQLTLGEPVIVVGNPISLDFQNTVGEGIVSGLDRNVPVDIDKDNRYDILMHSFQVDAPINPGDSGGAIVDQNGQLIGIASLKISMPNVENMAFGIPINEAVKVAKLLEKDGEINHPNTQIQLQNVTDIDENTKQNYTIDNQLDKGAVVLNMKDNSPAQNSDLKIGDVIIAVDGKSIQNALEYRQKIFRHTQKQQPVKLKVLRAGQEKEISFKLK
ncbi:trypsin-like peptidase domain-containing protein [Staphylococcus sp. 11262D007BW]